MLIFSILILFIVFLTFLLVIFWQLVIGNWKMERMNSYILYRYEVVVSGIDSPKLSRLQIALGLNDREVKGLSKDEWLIDFLANTAFAGSFQSKLKNPKFVKDLYLLATSFDLINAELDKVREESTKSVIRDYLEDLRQFKMKEMALRKQIYLVNQNSSIGGLNEVSDIEISFDLKIDRIQRLKSLSEKIKKMIGKA